MYLINTCSTVKLFFAIVRVFSSFSLFSLSPNFFSPFFSSILLPSIIFSLYSIGMDEEIFSMVFKLIYGTSLSTQFEYNPQQKREKICGKNIYFNDIPYYVKVKEEKVVSHTKDIIFSYGNKVIHISKISWFDVLLFVYHRNTVCLIFLSCSLHFSLNCNNSCHILNWNT